MLLIFAIILTVGASSPTRLVLSQNYTTFTSFMTSVNQFSFTNTFSTPIQSLTSTSSGQTILIGTTYTLTAQNRGFCLSQDLSFEAQAGQPVTGLVSANQPSSLQVYILSDNDYSKWRNATTTYCDPTDNDIKPQWASPGEELLTNVNIQWTPPADGKYWLLPEAFYNGGTDTVTVNLISPTVQIVTSIVFSTSVAESMFATTQVLTSVQIQPLSKSLTATESGGLLLPIAALVVIIVVAIAVMVLRRKKQSKS